MKPLIAQILIGISILAAGALGYQSLRLIYMLSQVIPEETVFFGWSRWSFLRWLFVTFFPLALSCGAFVLHRDSISTRFGRVALFADALCIISSILGCAYAYRFVSALNRDA